MEGGATICTSYGLYDYFLFFGKVGMRGLELLGVGAYGEINFAGGVGLV